MRETRMSIPELVLVAATRVLLGAGIGLLVASKLRRQARLATGAALLGVGVLSTIPLAFEIHGRSRRLGNDGESRRAPANARA